MITRTVVRSGGGGGGGPSIPANITAMQGQVIGPPLGEIEITPGDCLYLKVKRLEIGDGVISGPVSIAGNVVSVTDGTNTAVVAVSDFEEVGDTVVIVIETIDGAMRIGWLV